LPKAVVKTTSELASALTAQALADLIDEFEFYKSQWPESEDKFYYFGKDGGYSFPQLTESHQIRHVHLWPSFDSPESKAWESGWARTEKSKKPTRKTSNRALVYAQDGHQYLLIYILPEPDAHYIAQGLTSETAALMNRFKEICEAFIFNKLDLNGLPYP
jgi:hypothetical protein